MVQMRGRVRGPPPARRCPRRPAPAPGSTCRRFPSQDPLPPLHLPSPPGPGSSPACVCNTICSSAASPRSAPAAPAPAARSSPAGAPGSSPAAAASPTSGYRICRRACRCPARALAAAPAAGAALGYAAPTSMAHGHEGIPTLLRHEGIPNERQVRAMPLSTSSTVCSTVCRLNNPSHPCPTRVSDFRRIEHGCRTGTAKP